MKRSKEKPQKKAALTHFTHSRFARILTLVLISVIVLVLFPAATYAEAETLSEKNLRLCEEAMDKLGDAIEAFSASDTSSNKEISQRTSVAVIFYRKEILDMQSDPLFSEMSFENKIMLSKAKGLAIGKVSWAFYSRIYEYPSLADDKKFTSEYEKISSEIASATLASMVEISLPKYISDINKTAFSQLIKSESRAGDSLAVNAIIEGSIDEISKLYSADSSEEEYRKIYKAALEEISLQRVKDKLSQELSAIYSIILPKENFSTDKHVALFVYQLESKTELDVEEMNNVLNNTILNLLDTLSVGRYTAQFIEQTKAVTSQFTEAASRVGIPPSLTEEFSDFKFEYAVALAKDKIADSLLSQNAMELAKIEEEYNRAGGIIDLCTNAEELDFEVKRAKLRADWFSEYKNACTEIKNILSPHSPDTVLNDAKAVYSKHDRQISLISFSQKNAEILTNAEFAKGVDALKEAKDKAKIEKYKADHAAIIAKPLEDVKSKNKSALQSAIKDAIVLESSLLEKISDITTDLGAKYKAAIKAELSEKQVQASAAHIWKTALTSLCKEIDGIAEALPISEIYATTERISDRAKAIEDIIDRFGKVVVSEEYKSFPDISKTSFINACSDAVETLLSVNLTPISWSQRLDEAAKDAELILHKGYLAESLRAMANTSKSKDASPIAEEAATNISKALTKEKAEEIYSDAKFKLSRIIYCESLLDRAEAIKKEITELEYITELRKTELEGKISGNIEALVNKIRSASTSSLLETAKKESDSFLDTISSEANTENLKAAKRLAEGSLAAANNEINKLLSELIYLSDIEKNLLQKNMATLNAELLAKIDSAKSLEELSKISLEANKGIEEFSSKIQVAELDACKRKINSEYENILSKKDIYSVDNYNSIANIINRSKSETDKCNVISDILEKQKSALDKIGNIPTILDTEKQRALDTLNTLFSSIESKKTLYAGNKFNTVKQLYKSAIERISAISDPKDHQKIEPILVEAITDITSIRQDRVQTSDSLILSNNGSNKYPAGYSISEDGYPAYITAEGKIPYGTTLKLTSISSSDKHGVLRKLLRKGQVLTSSGSALTEELSKKLKKSTFLLGFNLESSLEFDGTEYKLTILLPDETDIQRIIGVVKISENKSAEFYKFSIDGSLLTISTSEAGEFYIAVEKNNLPLIIALILILLLLTPLGYFVTRYMRDTGIPPFAPRRSQEPPKDLPETTAIQPISTTREISQREKPQEPAETKENTQDQADTKESEHKNHGESQNSNGETVEIDDEFLFGTLVDDISTESDVHDEKDVKNTERNQENERPEKEKKKFTASFMGIGAKFRREEINLDVIAKNFKAGDTVTLDAMIKKGLLPPETTFVKVLARGKINKPLTVIPQDFSTAAMKTILLAGGNATITEEKLTLDEPQ